MPTENIPLTYKGRPLRRKDNLIYYGTMAEKYIIMLQILSTKTVDGLEMADKVSIQLQLTDPELKGRHNHRRIAALPHTCYPRNGRHGYSGLRRKPSAGPL